MSDDTKRIAASPSGGVRSWLGLEPNIVVILTVLMIVGMGEELWLRFIPKYLTVLGAGAWGVALYGTVRDLLDALYQYPGGWLADRVGRGRALKLFTLLALVGYVGYLMSPSWPWMIASTALVMAWSSMTLPAFFAVIGDNLPRNRRAIGFGINATVKKLPTILAPPLGGLLIAALGIVTGIKVALAITIVLAGIATIILHRAYREPPVARGELSNLRGIWRAMDPGLKRLLAADCMARWAEGVPKVFVVLYVIDVLATEPVRFGWLTSIQMAVSILTYIPVAKLADRMNRKPLVLLTFVFFALFPLALATARGLPLLIGAFIVGGLREIGEPARKAQIVDLAAEGSRARAVGVYYLVRGLVVFPSALVGGWLWGIDPSLPLYGGFVAGAAGLVTYALWGPNDVGNGTRQEE